MPLTQRLTNDAAKVAKCEHHHKLPKLAKATFPDGNVLMRYLIPVRQLQHDTFPLPRLPLWFCKIKPMVLTACDVFEYIWCLWDTGTYCTMIPSHYLHPGATGRHETGFTSLKIMYTPFSHLQFYHWPFTIRSARNQRLQSPFNPKLLNQADFIILSQQVQPSCQ